VNNWHANFIRLTLESYASAGGRVNWAGILSDSDYLADIQNIVAYIGTKPGVYVEVSLWADPSFTSTGWPTTATQDIWRRLATTFANSSHVLFGLVNEPQMNYEGAWDDQVWQAMNSTVQVIRDTENSLGTPHHIVSVQGTGGWGRFLDYYTTHPIAAGGGSNVVYETHVYDGQAQFARLFQNPSKVIPVIIGEFGPSGDMTEADAGVLMALAEAAQVPYLAWTFHMRCAPNLLVDNSNGGCGVSMVLKPTSWGTLLKNRLAQPLAR
jgi:hypothetical protein